jgi:hypothetical protein
MSGIKHADRLTNRCDFGHTFSRKTLPKSSGSRRISKARNQHEVGSKQKPLLDVSFMLAEDTCFSKTSVDLQRTTWSYIPEDRTLHNRHCRKLKSRMRPPLYAFIWCRLCEWQATRKPQQWNCSFLFPAQELLDANAPERLRVATAVQVAGPCRQASLSVTCVGGQPLIAEQEPTGSWPNGQGVKEESLLPIQNWQQGNSRRSSLLTALHRHCNHFRDLSNITTTSEQTMGRRKQSKKWRMKEVN